MRIFSIIAIFSMIIPIVINAEVYKYEDSNYEIIETSQTNIKAIKYGSELVSILSSGNYYKYPIKNNVLTKENTKTVSITNKYFNICPLNSTSFLFAQLNKFEVLEIDFPTPNIDNGIEFISSQNENEISMDVVSEIGSKFIIAGTSDKKSKILLYNDEDKNKKEVEIDSENIACISMEHIFCFYFSGKNIKLESFDSSLDNHKSSSLENGMNPKTGDIKGIKVQLYDTNILLLSMLISESQGVYLYGTTGSVNGETITKISPGNKYATVFFCNPDVKYLSVTVSEGKVIYSICRDSGNTNNYKFSGVMVEGNSMKFTTNICSLSYSGEVKFPTLIGVRESLNLFFILNNNKAIFQVLDNTNCKDYDVNSPSFYSINSDYINLNIQDYIIKSLFGTKTEEFKILKSSSTDDSGVKFYYGSAAKVEIDYNNYYSQNLYFKTGQQSGKISFQFLPKNGNKACNFTLNVQPCHSACKNCNEKGTLDSEPKCIECSNGYAPLVDDSSKCFSINSVQKGYYYNSTDNNFQLCYESCSDCNGFGTSKANNCKDCKENYYKLPDHNTMCVKGEQDFYFFDTNEGSYKKCAEGCKKCSDVGINPTEITVTIDSNNQKTYKKYDKMNCKDCEDGYLPSNDTSKQNFCWNEYTKPENYFVFTNNGVQMYNKCYDGCKTCSGFGKSSKETNCLSCDTSNIPPFYPKENEGDVCWSEQTKEENYFLSKTDSQNLFWKECQKGCKSCSVYGTPEDTNCIECDNSKNYYKAEKSASTKAVSSKLLCYQKGNAPKNYFFSNNQFYLCHDLCASCSEKGTDANPKCSTCIDSHVFVEGKTGICWEKKDDPSFYEGYYYDSNENKYKECYTGCKKCSSKGTTVHDTQCLADSCDKDKGYFPLIDDPTQCYKSDYQVPYYFFDQTVFKKCDDACLYCSGTSTVDSVTNEKKTNCQEKKCKDKYYPYEKDLTQCYTEKDKPSGTYLASNVIYDCSQACTECISGEGKGTKTNCKTETGPDGNVQTYCAIGYYPIKNDYSSCIDDGEQGMNFYYFDSDENLYVKCNQECMECDKEVDYCTKCSEDFDTFLFRSKDKKTSKCIQEEEKPSNYYLNKQKEEYWEYLECHEDCATCEDGLGPEGTPDNPCKDIKGATVDENDKTTYLCTRCTSCKEPSNYIAKNDPTGLCRETQCPGSSYYYINLEGQNEKVCTGKEECPSLYPYLIPNEKQCVKDCSSPYTKKYKNSCYKYCPEYTEEKETPNECVDVDGCRNEEIIIADELKDVPNKINSFASSYCKAYKDTEYQVQTLTTLEKAYTVLIFKSDECAKTSGNDLMMMDLASCPDKLKKEYGISKDSPLITLKMTIPREGSTSQIAYAFYNSETCECLSLDKCKDEKIKVNVPMNQTEGVDIDKAKEFASIGVDVYNSSDSFFNDICFNYTSENGYDVTLSDRRKFFFQNVSFCEEGCEYAGVNLTTQEAQCDCEIKTDFIADILDNPITGDFMELINAANFEVLQCFKPVFTFGYFIKNIGGWIMLTLIFVQIGFLVFYIRIGLAPIRIYLMQFMKPSPPKRDPSYDPNDPREKQYFEEIDAESHNTKDDSFTRGRKPPKKVVIMMLGKNYINEGDTDSTKKLASKEEMTSEREPCTPDSKAILDKIPLCVSKPKLSPIEKLKNKKHKELHKNVRKLHPSEETFKLTNIKGENEKEEDPEFSDGELNELEYEEAVKYERRSFCLFYWQQLKEKQDIINTFINTQILDPLPIKAIYFFFTIGLYFTLNGLFYSEDQISALYTSEDSDSFLFMIKNEFTRCIYSTMVGLAVSFCIECLTSTRSRIEMLIKREKDPDVFKEESIDSVNSMRKKNLIFIIFNFVFMVLFWYYCSSFCNCYINTQKRWLIGSVITWVIIQLIPFILCFVATALRYIGIKCKSEFCYNMSTCLTK